MGNQALEPIHIGIMGVTCRSGNKGCEALAYGVFEILEKIACENKIVINVSIVAKLPLKRFIRYGFNRDRCAEWILPDCKYNHLHIQIAFYGNLKNRVYLSDQIKKCKFIIDFTAGDSFTDLYGKERFYDRTNLKNEIIRHNIPLILGSQTIGPFSDEKVKHIAKAVLCRSKIVFVRDSLSQDYVKKISDVSAVLTTDVAMVLPYWKNRIINDSVWGVNA